MPYPNKKGNRHTNDSNSEDKSKTNNVVATKKSAQTKALTSKNKSDNNNISDISKIAEKADPSAVSARVELSPRERYEKKFSRALENSTDKSSKTRTLALQSLCEILMHRYMPDYVRDHKVILLDCIEKSIRRGKGTIEQMWALRLAPLLIVQLSDDEGISFKCLNEFLLTNVQEKSVSFDSRAKYCTALGLLNFLGDAEISDLLKLMKSFEGIFSASYLNSDDKTPLSVSAEAGTLHAKALTAWGLLFTLIPPENIVSWMSCGGGQSIMPSFKNLMGLLQSPNLAVRMAAGKTLALILDCGRVHDKEFLNEHFNNLVEAVKQLIIDSHKYRSKRYRKAQKTLFRDVLHYLEEDICPKITIHYGNDKDSLVLDSWPLHCQYSALCIVMGAGMTTQLQENEFVRDLFNFVPKPDRPLSETQVFPFSSTRKLRYAAAFKTRTKSRAENRDKRSAVVS